MYDVCIVTEGCWPRRTGGVATWTQHVTTALAPLNVAVLSLDIEASGSVEWTPPPNVHLLDRVTVVRRLPAARTYIASGLEAAEQLGAVRPDLLPRLRYVEHGDLVREILAGLARSESGRALAGADRIRTARQAALRRRAVARASGVVIGVTTRTLRRASREGAREVLCIPNAVPPPAAEPAGDPRIARAAAYVGRLCREKGVDRFVSLAGFTSAPLMALGIAPAAPCREVDVAGPVAFRHQPAAPWLPDIGVAVLPSRLEACPFVALEAEARGIPALVSDAAEIDETSLLTRLRWDPDVWGRQIDALLARGSDPRAGRAIAGRRWARFVAAWQAAVHA